MFLFGKPYKKFQKELDSIYSGKYLMDNKYEELLKKTQCRACPKYVAGKLPAYAEHFPCCGDCEKYPSVREMIEALDGIPVKAAALIESGYSKAVFETFAGKAPALVEEATGKACTWAEVFGSSYDVLSAEKRHELVGLIEGNSKYRLQ